MSTEKHQLIMNTLEDKILNFDNWSQPWTFHDYITKDKTLDKKEVSLFKDIWTRAGSAEIWNHSDLSLCIRASQDFIIERYQLSDTVTANIVRALSYQWR